jgi:hypothetical protein
LRKARPTLKAATSFNIVANDAPELSWCDYSAEAEIRRAEGEGEMIPIADMVDHADGGK